MCCHYGTFIFTFSRIRYRYLFEEGYAEKNIYLTSQEYTKPSFRPRPVSPRSCMWQRLQKCSSPEGPTSGLMPHCLAPILTTRHLRMEVMLTILVGMVLLPVAILEAVHVRLHAMPICRTQAPLCARHQTIQVHLRKNGK